MHEHVLGAREEMCGEKRPHIFTVMTHLAKVYEKQHKVNDAEELYTQVADQHRGSCDPDASEALEAMASLAWIDSEGRFSQLEKLLQEVLESR